MKKILFVFLMWMTASSVAAQENNGEKTVEKVMELQLQLDKLQQDFNLLSCRYELQVLILELSNNINDIGIKSNMVKIIALNGKFSRDLYRSLQNLYDTIEVGVEQLKKEAEDTKLDVQSRIEDLNIMGHERLELILSMEMIDELTSALQDALNSFDTAIELYRKR